MKQLAMKVEWRRFANLGGFVLIALGIVVASDTIRLPVSNQLPIGLEMCGVGLSVAFLDGLITGRIHSFFGKDFEWGYYEGLVARLWGGLMLLIGLALAAGGFIEWLRPGAVGSFVSSPAGLGSGAIFLGLVTGLFSLIKILQPVPQESSPMKRLSHILKRILWGLMMFVGVLIAGLGLLQLMIPGFFLSLMQLP
jgi:hypothetical protein